MPATLRKQLLCRQSTHSIHLNVVCTVIHGCLEAGQRLVRHEAWRTPAESHNTPAEHSPGVGRTGSARPSASRHGSTAQPDVRFMPP